MCQLPTHRQTVEQDGFTILEVLVAVSILAIGLMGAALLMSTTYKYSVHSRYMAEAAQLASEKLEDLDRFDKNDPSVANGGSLAADTVAGAVPYFDDVQISVDNGVISETTSTAGVSTSYVQQPGGNITVTQGAGLPAPTPDTLTFDRRWIIQANTPVAGVRTVTVLVTATGLALKPQVTFQMSMVRP